jgi:hypothetical protein
VKTIAFLTLIQYRPNPQPLPCKGRGVRFKASLLIGERFGKKSECIAYKQEALYLYSLCVLCASAVACGENYFNKFR